MDKERQFSVVAYGRKPSAVNSATKAVVTKFRILAQADGDGFEKTTHLAVLPPLLFLPHRGEFSSGLSWSGFHQGVTLAVDRLTRQHKLTEIEITDLAGKVREAVAREEARLREKHCGREPRNDLIDLSV